MRAWLTAILIGCGAMGLTGCSMCSPGFLDDYATVGGKIQRINPTEGRMGSPFSDPGTTFPSSPVPNAVPRGGTANGANQSIQEYGDGQSYYGGYGGEHYYIDEGAHGSFSDGGVEEGVIILGDQW